jgi:hypothetical protein
MASREPQRPEIDANRRREPLKRINLSGQLALMGETRRFRPFFRKLLAKERVYYQWWPCSRSATTN